MKTNHSTPLTAAAHMRKGGVLISLVAVTLVIGVLGVSVIAFTRSSEHSHLSANAGSRAYYLADSGLRYAQHIHCRDNDWLHGRQRTLTLQGGEQVDIIRLGDTFWATATVDVGTAKEARARVPMPLSLCGEDPDNDPIDEFAVFGDVAISLGNNTVIEGDVAITGDNVALKGIVDGNIYAADVTTTSSSATVTGSIFSSGFVDIRTGDVTGDIHSADGILLRSAQSTVFGGWLFSHGSIEVGGGSEVRGHIHSCAGDVFLSGSAIIGTPAEPVEVRAHGDVTLSGSATVYGNVYAGGIITVGGSIVGNAFAGGVILNPGAVTGSAIELSPTYVKQPICPDLDDLDLISLPDATEFTAGGDDIDVPEIDEDSPGPFIVAPGSYGAVSSSNNSSNTALLLSAGAADHANYYFNTISLGNDLTLYLDLSGSYDIRVFVVGDIAIGKDLNVLVSTDGTNYVSMDDDSVDPEIAARVYWESQSDFVLGATSNWLGSVYTPDGNLSVGNGSYLIGSYYSGGGHDITASAVVHVPPNYFAEE
ncbi:hypothetical protein HAHE_07750 [Haloferula helveola]|uniref:Polymer-forming cytoskeletal protein n=1 Tax=Haloferula helveola TaxID=490095 RepID=A0ABN6H2N1_9BACT|nr:hypothetical protein HAHE_07750 [Haloferula helveola]